MEEQDSEQLPKPQTDLPLPEKEIPEHATSASKDLTLRSYTWFFRNKIVVTFIVISFLIAFLIGGFVLGSKNKNQRAACTQEAKICPDGSSVGRTGPKCEFSPCPTPTKSGEAVFCAQDVKQCPNGSYVGRSGPNCEFAACPTPTPDPIADWQTYINSEAGWQINYPSDQDFKIETRPYTDYFETGKGLGYVISFVKIGPTQKQQTEFYDGISFSIAVAIKDKNMSLKDFAENETKPNPGVGSTREYFNETMVDGIKGYEAHVTSFGQNRYIFLPYPNDTGKAYRFFIISEGASKVEYDKVVNLMLSAFKFTD